MTENSFSSTSREMRSSAVTGCPIRGVKRRTTLSMGSLSMFGGRRASGCAGPVPQRCDGISFRARDPHTEGKKGDRARAREMENKMGPRPAPRLDDFEPPHQDAERPRDKRGNDEARHDLGDTRRRVHEERAVPG